MIFHFIFWIFMEFAFLYTNCISGFFWYFSFWYVVFGVVFSRYIFVFYTVLRFFFFVMMSFFHWLYFLFSILMIIFNCSEFSLPPCWKSFFPWDMFNNTLFTGSTVTFNKLHLKIKKLVGQWVTVIINRYCITLQRVQCVELQKNCCTGTWQAAILIFIMRIK